MKHNGLDLAVFARRNSKLRLDRKVGIVAVVAALLVALGAFGLGSPVQDASATVSKLRIVSEHGIDPAPGTTTSRIDCDAALGARVPSGTAALPTTPGANGALPVPTEVVATSGSILICVNVTSPTLVPCLPGSILVECLGKLTFDSNDYGSFDRAACGPLGTGDDGDVRIAEWGDDECVSVAGSGTDILIVETNPVGGGGVNNISVVIIRFTCQSNAGNTTISATQSDSSGAVTLQSFLISCRGQAGGITVTAAPTTVEIIPAPSNTAHSLIQVTATDSAGNPILLVPGTEIDFITDRCGIEESGVDDASELAIARAATAALSTALPSTYIAQTAIANAVSPDTASPQTDQSGFFDIALLGS
jgi:hypothetical protein